MLEPVHKFSDDLMIKPWWELHRINGRVTTTDVLASSIPFCMPQRALSGELSDRFSSDMEEIEEDDEKLT